MTRRRWPQPNAECRPLGLKLNMPDLIPLYEDLWTRLWRAVILLRGFLASIWPPPIMGVQVRRLGRQGTCHWCATKTINTNLFRFDTVWFCVRAGKVVVVNVADLTGCSVLVLTGLI